MSDRQTTILKALKKWATPKRVDASDSELENLIFLLSHGNIKSRWRTTPAFFEEKYHLLMLQVVGNRGNRIDDKIYRKHARLQKLVPRGLCYVFRESEEVFNLKTLVYPTSKFFGDDDQDEDVVVVGDQELQEEVPKGTRLVATEKANGEMFTLTVVERENNGTYHIVAGSKNNKFLFTFHCRNTTQQQIRKQIRGYLIDNPTANCPYPEIDMDNNPGWTYQNVWVEMCQHVMFDMLQKPDASQALLDRLFTEKLTACGEFESWVHPHVVGLPSGHRIIKFFAMTSCDSTGGPTEETGAVRIKNLQWLAETGFTTVTVNELPSDTDIMNLRRQVWQRSQSEGLVLLVLDPSNGQILRMFKMKTVWYVVHRGMRERLRRFIFGKDANTTGQARWERIEKELQGVVKQKQLLFKLPPDNKWLEIAVKMAQSVKEIEEKEGLEGLKTVFSYRYPTLVDRSET